MERLGIHLGADLRKLDLAALSEHFGKSARYLYLASRGRDDRPVQPNRIRKSVGRERTYGEDLCSEADLYAALDEVLDSVWQRIQRAGVSGRTVTLKVKYADFRQITRSRSTQGCLTRSQFAALARELLSGLIPVPLGVRLLGVSLSALEPQTAEQAAGCAEPAARAQQAFDF
jgi:DNA polymerase-4